jgi:hypothetical protein
MHIRPLLFEKGIGSHPSHYHADRIRRVVPVNVWARKSNRKWLAMNRVVLKTVGLTSRGGFSSSRRNTAILSIMLIFLGAMTLILLRLLAEVRLLANRRKVALVRRVDIGKVWEVGDMVKVGVYDWPARRIGTAYIRIRALKQFGSVRIQLEFTAIFSALSIISPTAMPQRQGLSLKEVFTGMDRSE